METAKRHSDGYIEWPGHGWFCDDMTIPTRQDLARLIDAGEAEIVDVPAPTPPDPNDRPTAIAARVLDHVLKGEAVPAGCHRNFSHRAFSTSRIFQLVLAFLAQSSAQKSVL
jgi:hypothetical protein